MNIDKIKKIECKFEGDSDDMSESDLNEDNYLLEDCDVVKATLKGKKLFLEIKDGREFYFVKKYCQDWSHAYGFLINPEKYSSENRPLSVRIYR